MTTIPIPDIFMKYLEDTLFEDNICHFLEEVIIDNIPVFITLNNLEDEGIVRLILYNENINKKLHEVNTDAKDCYLYNLLNNADIIHHLCPHLSITEKCKLVLQRLNDVIRDIRFCKYLGKFINKLNISYSKLHEFMPELFSNNDNIKFKQDVSNSCVVCYDKTKTTTSCNHPICIPCAMNVKHDIDDDVLCPICRDIMTFV